MAIRGIPNVVVLETVHVHLEGTIVSKVHVSNEDLCDMSSESLLY